MPFSLHSEYSPSGDQGPAIEKLVKSIAASNGHQTLLGVTGSGKTFTAANIIERIGKPTLVIVKRRASLEKMAGGLEKLGLFYVG